MSWTDVADLLGLVCLLLGALLCVAAGIGLLRFPDLLTRMHAGTKPQVLGLLFVLLALALRIRTVPDALVLLLVGFFQLLTIPAGAHMVGRAGFRTGQVHPADIHPGRRSGAAAPDVAQGPREPGPGS